jgi:hypothetical protein
MVERNDPEDYCECESGKGRTGDKEPNALTADRTPEVGEILIGTAALQAAPAKLGSE